MTPQIPEPVSAALRTVVAELSGTAITWAVTGSCSLALQGVPVAVHDLDLRTTARDAYALADVLERYLTRPVRFSSTGQVQSHFGALTIHGAHVEIIGDMQHRLEDGSWEPIVDMNQFKRWVTYQGVAVPVMSLPFLLDAYRLLGRADKVELLTRWLESAPPA
ncbi:MAG: hypothetical protein DIU80_011335 [Chloroflexota bacterium]|nr:MAG: hypothetical protein DIU80_03405 [Chloroflexota bacterium]